MDQFCTSTHFLGKFLHLITLNDIKGYKMSSTFTVQRICKHCSKEFTAQKITTQYCGHTCASRAHKARIRNSKIQKSNAEVEAIKTKQIDGLKEKEFLTVKEVSILLNCSIRSVYYSIEHGNLNAINLSSRMTRIRRSDIDFLFQVPEEKVETVIVEVKPLDIKDCYDIRDVQKMYNVSYNGLNAIIKRNQIPKIRKGWFTYVHKQTIDNIMSK